MDFTTEQIQQALERFKMFQPRDMEWNVQALKAWVANYRQHWITYYTEHTTTAQELDERIEELDELLDPIYEAEKQRLEMIENA